MAKCFLFKHQLLTIPPGIPVAPFFDLCRYVPGSCDSVLQVEVIQKPSWKVVETMFGVTLGRLGPCWGHVGAMLGLSWAILLQF